MIDIKRQPSLIERESWVSNRKLSVVAPPRARPPSTPRARREALARSLSCVEVVTTTTVCRIRRFISPLAHCAVTVVCGDRRRARLAVLVAAVAQVIVLSDI